MTWSGHPSIRATARTCSSRSSARNYSRAVGGRARADRDRSAIRRLPGLRLGGDLRACRAAHSADLALEGSAGDPSTLATNPSACVVNIVSRVTPDGTRIEFDRAARASVPANPAGPELRLTQSSIPYPQAMPESRVTTPLLTPRFRRAFALASEAHATQVRKGTKIPYLAPHVGGSTRARVGRGRGLCDRRTAP